MHLQHLIIILTRIYFQVLLYFVTVRCNIIDITGINSCLFYMKLIIIRLILTYDDVNKASRNKTKRGVCTQLKEGAIFE